MEDMSYGEYLLLTQEEQSYYSFCIHYAKDKIKYEVKNYFDDEPVENKKFSFVKECMELYSDGNFDELVGKIIENLPNLTISEILKASAYKVLLTFDFICDRLQTLILMENETLISTVAGNDYSSQVEQINFSQFSSYYSQRDSLANGDITKYKEIDDMPYKDCYIKLVYNQKQADLEKLVLKSK